MADDWKEYQEEAAEFFRSLGLKAETDLRIQGVRTSHDIDVLVTIDMAGFDVRWFVECKYWKTAVNKLHVLALREIVADCGADRGIILCEEGFQSGAIEAANLTNVQVTSLAALAESSKDAIYAARLRDLFDRTEETGQRYWRIPKDVRIDKGLRGETGEVAYSGNAVIEVCREILTEALRGKYPIEVHNHPLTHSLPNQLDSPQGVVALLDELLSELEAKLDAV
ncbi:MAG: restriction endonuclease [Mesorhizobium sp.]|nr:MAG: restriction endonuclease [Mesorhizobium sp.]